MYLYYTHGEVDSRPTTSSFSSSNKFFLRKKERKKVKKGKKKKRNEFLTKMPKEKKGRRKELQPFGGVCSHQLSRKKNF